MRPRVRYTSHHRATWRGRRRVSEGADNLRIPAEMSRHHLEAAVAPRGGGTATAKLVRMLQLTARHKGAHLALALAAGVALSYYSSRQAARLSARRRAIQRLLEKSSRPASRVQSALHLEGMDEYPTNASATITRSQSLLSLQQLAACAAVVVRKQSEVSLAELTGKVCDECLSRCVTHESLIRLDEQNDDEPTNKAFETDATTTVVASSAASSSSTAVDSPPRCVKCARRSCQVCTEVESSWRRALRSALRLSLGATLAYVLWLRFVASRSAVRSHILTITRIVGERFFGYRVMGGENIPRSGPAIVTAYHGFVPIDMYFLHEWIQRTTGRLPTTLCADFVFRIPLFGYLCRVCGAVPASRENAMAALRAGAIVVVAPGGVREGMATSAEDYLLRWYGKTGFAEIAHEAKVAIVPMFTRNVREVFLVLGGSLPLVQKLYRLTRLPFTPFIGPLPVPLTSVLGEPLQHVDGTAAADIAKRVREALQALITTHTGT